MKLVIRRNDGDPRDVKLLRVAVPFMLKRLLKPAQFSKVHLHITLTRLHGDFGDIEIETSPRFRLRLHHGMDTLVMLVTLAHELLHLSQVMHGRLELRKIKDLQVWYWDGEPYGSAPYDELGSDIPWERDAGDKENDLARHFFTHYVTSLNGV